MTKKKVNKDQTNKKYKIKVNIHNEFSLLL